jgi:hypothetical protein
MAPTTLPRPVYFVAGASDLVADELKKFAAHAPELQARAEALPAELRKLAETLPADLQKLAATLPSDLQKFATDLPSYAAQLQAKAREIDVDEVTAAVKKNVETAQAKAAEVYTELVERGQKVVTKSGKAETVKAETVKAETVKAETVKAETVKAETPTPAAIAEKKAPAKKAAAKKAPSAPSKL